ncbi:MAG TPA: site-specific integrase [Acidimicrobiales bacterium]|nr:site-specific integrase [Acidimicrobiales bacterium]
MRGTKRQRKPGVWELRVYVGNDPKTGRPLQTSKTFHGGAREADAALRALVESRAPSRTDGVGATFGQLLDEWLAECERLELSPTTLRNYRSQIKSTLRPALGKVTLARLTAKHLDDFYGTLKARGLSARTVHHYHATISAALHQAVRWGWVRQNVASLAKAPKIVHHRVSVPSVALVRRVVEVAEERDPEVAALLMFAALTGMRRGELCGLRWSDVELELGRVEVARSVVVVSGGVAEKSTKTNRARYVALDPVGVGLLKARLEDASSAARDAGVELLADGYVFSPELDGSEPFRPDYLTSFFTKVRKVADAPEVRLHDLRHFTATQLIGAGVDVRTVAGRLGHSDPSLTLRVYGHVIEERDRAAAAVMGRLLSVPNE